VRIVVLAKPVPALVAVTQMVGEPRYPSLRGIMGARSKEIATVGLDELGLHRAALGGDAATTRVLRARAPAARTPTRVVRAQAVEAAHETVEFLAEISVLGGRAITSCTFAGEGGIVVLRPNSIDAEPVPEGGPDGFTLGVSGALPHKVGMQTADTIVAVNRDPDAPLAQYADLYVVGDLFEVGPALAAELRSRQG